TLTRNLQSFPTRRSSDLLKNGKGTAGKLLNDDELYNNLEHASKQMEELIQDIKLNPKRYVSLNFSIFGKKDKDKAYEKPDDPLKIGRAQRLNSSHVSIS